MAKKKKLPEDVLPIGQARHGASGQQKLEYDRKKIGRKLKFVGSKLFGSGKSDSGSKGSDEKIVPTNDDYLDQIGSNKSLRMATWENSYSKAKKSMDADQLRRWLKNNPKPKR